MQKVKTDTDFVGKILRTIKMIFFLNESLVFMLA